MVGPRVAPSLERWAAIEPVFECALELPPDSRSDRHYLALRPEPEGRVQPEVDRIRRELAVLERGGRTASPVSH